MNRKTEVVMFLCLVILALIAGHLALSQTRIAPGQVRQDGPWIVVWRPATEVVVVSTPTPTEFAITLANTPRDGTVSVYRNGLLQQDGLEWKLDAKVIHVPAGTFTAGDVYQVKYAF